MPKLRFRGIVVRTKRPPIDRVNLVPAIVDGRYGNSQLVLNGRRSAFVQLVCPHAVNSAVPQMTLRTEFRLALHTGPDIFVEIYGK